MLLFRLRLFKGALIGPFGPFCPMCGPEGPFVGLGPF